MLNADKLFQKYGKLTIIFEPVFPPSTWKICPGIAHDNTAVELIVIVGF